MLARLSPDHQHDLELVRTQLEVSSLKARHLRLVDTKQWDEYAAMLTEDFVLDISQTGNVPVIRGREAAVKQVQTSVEGVTTVHQAHLPEFEIDRNELQVIWSIHGRVVRGAHEPSFTLYGHHHDRWVRHNGKWKLSGLRMTALHIDVHAPTHS